MKVSPSRSTCVYLILFWAWRKALSLCIQFDKSSSHSLHPGMQGPIFIILSVEVILVILALLVGDDGNIFSNKTKGKWRGAVEQTRCTISKPNIWKPYLCVVSLRLSPTLPLLAACHSFKYLPVEIIPQQSFKTSVKENKWGEGEGRTTMVAKEWKCN